MKTRTFNRQKRTLGTLILQTPALLILSLVAICSVAQVATAGVLGDFADETKRESVGEELRLYHEANLAKAQAFTRRANLPAKGLTADGRVFELTGLTEDGRPMYMVTLNANAGLSTNAAAVQEAPYGATGEGFLAGVWDAGAARITHQEFMNTGTSRITVGDGAMVDPHGTAVAGTMIAAGVDAAALGMAPLARIKAYSWVWDTWELTSQIAAKPTQALSHMMISNHSYGLVHGWESGDYGNGPGDYFFGQGYKEDGTGNREDSYFGRYGSEASYLDYLASGAPYWLYFKAAGNDRDDGYRGPTDGTGTFYYLTNSGFSAATYDPETAPFQDGYEDGGFDTIIEAGNAKNIITVGSVNDAVLDGLRDPSKATMSNFSAWGPADDGRIKPDIVANGVGIYTPISSSDTAYSSNASGTSFSSPNAAGSALLLNDMAMRNLNGAVLRASTVKGLLLHSATDLGRPGPDYTFGWGLVDVKKAADIILAHAEAPGAFHLVESLLNEDHPAEHYSVYWDGASDLEVTISWTDPRRAAFPAGEVDNRTPALVNDLDLRLEGPSGLFFPFTLDPLNPAEDATTGDNVVDNIEKVIVPAGVAPGTYTIHVTHKGTLEGGKQWYSLISNGQSPAPVSAPALSAVSPAVVNTPGKSILEVAGNVFELGSQIQIRREGELIQEAAGEFAAMGRVFGEIDTTGWEYGEYDVTVITPDGREATLPAAFRYTNSPPEILSTEESVTMHEGERTSIDFMAMDYSDDVELHGVALPAWATLVTGAAGNPTMGSLTIWPTYADGGTTHSLHIAATDNSVEPGTTVLEVQVIVLNTPTILEAYGRRSGAVIITFDSPMAESGDGAVLDPSAYTIQSSAGDPLEVYSVVKESGNSYQLHTSEQVSEEEYTIAVAGVTDVDGNPIATAPAFCTQTFLGVNFSSVADWRDLNF